MDRLSNLTGQKFGRLYAKNKIILPKHVKYLCECECGNECEVYAFSLKTGRTTSCGCFQVEQVGKRSLKHGHSKPKYISRIYKIWQQMKQRCGNPNAYFYHRYGGRGIKVCERWNKFENFLTDMGEPPSKDHSIDRFPNNDGNYEPSNCRWATRLEQASNQSSPSIKLKEYHINKKNKYKIFVASAKLLANEIKHNCNWNKNCEICRAIAIIRIMN